jgi:hypothetical protein
LTNAAECGRIEPQLRLGEDLILKYPYQKGKATYTTKIVRVVEGMVYILDPSTKEQILVGQALWIGNVLVMAMTVHKEQSE